MLIKFIFFTSNNITFFLLITQHIASIKTQFPFRDQRNNVWSMICFYASINSKMYSMLFFLCLDRWQFKRIFLIRLCVFFFYWFWTYMIYRLTRFIFFHIARMIFCLVFCYSIAYNWATSKKMMAPKAWPTEKKTKETFIYSSCRENLWYI